MDPVWRSDCTQISKLLFPERWQGTKYLISCRSLSTRICHWHPKFSKNTTDYKNFRFGLFCKPNHHANYKLLKFCHFYSTPLTILKSLSKFSELLLYSNTSCRTLPLFLGIIYNLFAILYIGWWIKSFYARTPTFGFFQPKS